MKTRIKSMARGLSWLALGLFCRATTGFAQTPPAKPVGGLPAGFTQLRRVFDGLAQPLCPESWIGDWKHVLQATPQETAYRPAGLTTIPSWLLVTAPLSSVAVPAAVYRQYTPRDEHEDWGPKTFQAENSGRTLELSRSEALHRPGTDIVIKRRWTMPCRLTPDDHLLCLLTRTDSWQDGPRAVTIVSESFAAFTRR